MLDMAISIVPIGRVAVYAKKGRRVLQEAGYAIGVEFNFEPVDESE